MNCNIHERRKYAKDLLLKVRLPLLPKHTLRYILKDSTTIYVHEDCVAMLNDLLKKKENCIDRKASSYYTHMYCSHSKFNFLFCGGRDKLSNKVVGNVNQIDGSNLKSVKTLPSVIQRRYFANTVCLKGEIYVFGGRDGNNKFIKSVQKYSLSTRKWTKVADMYDNRVSDCLCAFMDKIFVFGGHDYNQNTNSCLQFDTKDYN